MIMVNLFVGIICEAFESVRSESGENEYEMGSFVSAQAKKAAGGGGEYGLRVFRFASGQSLFYFRHYQLWVSHEDTERDDTAVVILNP